MTTLTKRVAAIQLKMLHLQYRMKKIYEDQAKLNKLVNKVQSPREQIRSLTNSAYTTIDMLITFEHLFQLIADIFNTPELKDKIDNNLRNLLGRAKTVALKWKPVRNKLGGHIDIEMVISLCEKHNFEGVFLSDDLETDVSAMNMLLIESAVNSAQPNSDLFGRKLDFNKNGLTNELKIFVETLNKDWNLVYSYFTPMMNFLYAHGKAEKMNATSPEDRKGIIVD